MDNNVENLYKFHAKNSQPEDMDIPQESDPKSEGKSIFFRQW